MSIRFSLALNFAVLILIASNGFRVFGSPESDAVAAIAAAEEYIVLSYDAVLEAEAVGANITTLRMTLTKAANQLSRAELSFRSNDFNSAILFANQSREQLLGLSVEAGALAEVAITRFYWDFIFTIVGSGVGVIVIISSSFVLWHLLRKKSERGPKL